MNQNKDHKDRLLSIYLSLLLILPSFSTLSIFLLFSNQNNKQNTSNTTIDFELPKKHRKPLNWNAIAIQLQQNQHHSYQSN